MVHRPHCADLVTSKNLGHICMDIRLYFVNIVESAYIVVPTKFFNIKFLFIRKSSWKM